VHEGDSGQWRRAEQARPSAGRWCISPGSGLFWRGRRRKRAGGH
jgi:hypothetical protein